MDLRSDDYAYNFHLPQLDVIEVALPGEPYELSVRTESPGTLELRGGQMCGFSHPELIGDLVVHQGEGFDRWLAENAPGGKATDQAEPVRPES